jgi:hypothetical protein
MYFSVPRGGARASHFTLLATNAPDRPFHL